MLIKNIYRVLIYQIIFSLSQLKLFYNAITTMEYVTESSVTR